MSSGNLLVSFGPADNKPPAANYATPDERNADDVLDFDAGADEAAVFKAILPRHYDAGGLTVTICWMATSATSGNVVWTAAVERLADEDTDHDADSFATAQTATGAAPATSGMVQYTSITLTHAQIDGLLAGELFRLKITRDADHASDTMTGDAELLAVEVRET